MVKVKETRTMRTHVVRPRELVESVDELVGERESSQFTARAVAETEGVTLLTNNPRPDPRSTVTVQVTAT